ncbi:MAG: TetR/AcrR family transcriptional regulator [Acidimicrobiales bacterium]
MGRHPNPQRKVDLIAEIVDYILDNGLTDLSLRPLAKELGTSTYTLTYQFGSKEAMVIDAVNHIDERQTARLSEFDSTSDSPSQILQRLWDQLVDEEGRRWSQVMLEVATLTSRQPILFEEFEANALKGRIDHLAAAFGDGDPTDQDVRYATLTCATVQGLVLDALLTGDLKRNESALCELLDQVANPDARVASASASLGNQSFEQ